MKSLPEKTTDNFAATGMAWWNSLSESARIVALAAAGSNASVADAYRHYLDTIKN